MGVTRFNTAFNQNQIFLKSSSKMEIDRNRAQIIEKVFFGSSEIQAHAPEETGALNQRLRPIDRVQKVQNCTAGLCRVK